MSGGLFTRAVARELGRPLSDTEVEEIQRRHGALFRELVPERRPLPGAVELLAHLREADVPFGIATSGRRPEIDASLEILGVGSDVVVVERGDVLRAKPEPDLFLACQERMGVHIRDCTVVGIDNLLTGDVANISHLVNRDFTFIKHDVTNYIYIDGPVDYVLHWASPASPIDYLELPIPTLKVGALGTHKALGLAKAELTGPSVEDQLALLERSDEVERLLSEIKTRKIGGGADTRLLGSAPER